MLYTYTPKRVCSQQIQFEIDNGIVKLTTNFDGEATIKAIVKEGDRIVFAGEIDRSEAMIKIPNPRLWSPEDPFLYDIALALCSADGTILDAVTSYFGMRKFSIGYDDKRIPRLCLNNKPYFQFSQPALRGQTQK